MGEIALRSAIPLAALGSGAWWLLWHSLTPITTLTEKAEHIQIHNLSERLPRSGNGDELDRLTEVFNAMMARLDHSFRSIREFTLNASHELKTPLAVLHGEIETAMNDPATTPAQREAYGSQLDEIQRLSKIVEGLTLLAKADAGQMALTQEPVRFDELVRNSFADAQILAQPKQISVSLDGCDEVTVRGDRHRLRQLLLNLTDNAMKYNQPKGRVCFALRRSGSQAELTIANTGPGIPNMNAPEDRDHAISRFREGPILLEHTVMGLPDSELDFKPSGGGWSIRQIVHHIVDGDDIWKLCIKMAIGTEQAEFSLGWYSLQTQDAWADRWAYKRRSIGASLSLLKASREHVLQLLASVPEAWNRAVVVRTPHGEIERIPVSFVIQMQGDHVLHHLKRIQANLQVRGGP